MACAGGFGELDENLRPVIRMRQRFRIFTGKGAGAHLRALAAGVHHVDPYGGVGDLGRIGPRQRFQTRLAGRIRAQNGLPLRAAPEVTKIARPALETLRSGSRLRMRR